MRNYVIKPGFRGMFSVDQEKEDYNVVEPMRSHIDWAYVAPEDGVLNISQNEKKEVKKGDIVIAFYSSPYTKNTVIVIDNEQWKENIQAEEEYENTRKEQCECDMCEKCECDACPNCAA